MAQGLELAKVLTA